MSREHEEDREYEREQFIAQLKVCDQLIEDRNRILKAHPCPMHGDCVPYVLEKIAGLEADKEAAIDSINYYVSRLSHLECVRSMADKFTKTKPMSSERAQAMEGLIRALCTADEADTCKKCGRIVAAPDCDCATGDATA